MMLPITAGFATPELLDVARACDSKGLQAIGIGEFAGTEAFSLSGAVAAITQHTKIETGVVSVLTRSPALLSMGAATLHHLSNGRFILGLGAGSPIGAEYHERSFDRPLSNLAHAVDEIREVVNGGQLDSSGRFRLTGIAGAAVSIYVSAIGERMLRFAATRTDGVFLSMLTGLEGVRQASSIVRQARDSDGCTNPFSVIAIHHGYAGPDPAEGELAFRHEIAPYFAVSTYRDALLGLATEGEVEQVADAWKAGGRKAAAPLIPKTAVEALFIAGGVDEFAERLAELGNAGADSVRFLPARTGDLNQVMSLIDVLASASEA